MKPIIPKVLIPGILRDIHEISHFGREKNLQSFKESFYSELPERELKLCAYKCLHCMKHKPLCQKKQLTGNTDGEYPWHTIGIDIMEMHVPSEGYNYILIVVDHFSMWLEVFPLIQKEMNTVIKTLWNLFTVMGNPKRIVGDSAFNTHAFQRWTEQESIDLHPSIPYHHEGNPRAERGIGIVRPILNILKEFGGEWASGMKEIAFNYRSTVNKATGETPFFLMFGRKCPNTWTKGIMPEKEFFTPWQDMNNLHKNTIDIIRENALKKRVFERENPKKRSSTTNSCTTIGEGDLVLLKVQQRASKDLPRYEKLCRVVGVDKTREGGLLLKHIKGNKRVILRHVNDVKKDRD